MSLAAVGEVGTLDQRAYYYPTVSATPATLKRPYFIGNAQLADNGKQTVLTTSAYGSVSGKVAVASKSSDGTKWGRFKNVAGSYTEGGIERLVTAGGHIRMVGVSAKAIYTPDSWTWNGTSFGKPKPSGDHNDVFALDTASDGSGRLVSVGTESGGLAVSNFGTGSHAVALPVQGQGDPRRRAGPDLHQHERSRLHHLGHREDRGHRTDPQGPGDQALGADADGAPARQGGHPVADRTRVLPADDHGPRAGAAASRHLTGRSCRGACASARRRSAPASTARS